MQDDKFKINFLNSHLKPSVKCSVTSDDLYLPQNLISSDVAKRNLGFMAYSVTQPPIELEFNLVCHINLLCIRIWPKIQSLKSTAFEIFVKGDHLRGSDYVKVGSCYDLSEDGVTFLRLVNDRDVKDSDNEPFRREQPHFKAVNFHRLFQQRIMRQVKTIKICIKRTARCVPVLQRVEVWGNVSMYENIEKSQLALNLWKAACDKSDSLVNHFSPRSPRETSTKEANPDFSPAAVPEEFLDAITCDIMSIPMVLPSGKTIDLSTLNKHSRNEECWGRAPSDPYSGQCFTSERKATLNSALKAQIDRFLLQNSCTREISEVPRTVGTVTKRSYSNRLSGTRNQKNLEEPPNASKKHKLEDRPAMEQPSTSRACSSLTPGASITRSTLDDAVANALKNITRFSYQRKTPSIAEEICRQCDGSAENHLYKINKCTHLICRKCLTDRKISVCACGISFKSGDLVKHNKKSLLDI